MGLFNNDAIHNVIVESERNIKEMDREIANRELANSARGAAMAGTSHYQEMVKYKKEAEKYKKLFNEMKNRSVTYENNLAFWITNQKGARQLAQEYGILLGKTDAEIDQEINDRALKSINNELGPEFGNNANQAKSAIVNDNLDQAPYYASYVDRVDYIKKRFSKAESSNK